MSRLYLCKGRMAKTPYYLKDISMNVYSIEELCYALKANIYIVEDSLMDERLVAWIANELGMEILADRLKDVLNSTKSFSEFVIRIMEYSGYLKYSEIDYYREILLGLENQSVFVRKKTKADNLLKEQHYIGAIMEYYRIIDLVKTDKTITKTDLGNVYNNLGTAYAKLFLFEKASECYKEAYTYNKLSEIMKRSRFAKYLAENKNFFDEGSLKRELDISMDDVTQELLIVANEEGSDELEYKLNHLRDYRRNGMVAQYYSEIGDILEEWKSNYRKSISS